MKSAGSAYSASNYLSRAIKSGLVKSAPGPHDTGMVTMVTQKQNEFELHARAILGLPVDTSLQKDGSKCGYFRRHRRQGRCL